MGQWMPPRVNTESPVSRRGTQEASGKQICIQFLLLKRKEKKNKTS